MPWIADPYSYLLPAQSSEQALIEKTEGLVSLTPRLAFSGLASHGDVTIAFVGEGIDPVRERPISSRITIVSGRDLADVNEHAVLLAEVSSAVCSATRWARAWRVASASNQTIS